MQTQVGMLGVISSLPTKLAKIDLQFSEFFGVTQNNSGSNSITWQLDRNKGYTISSYSKYFDCNWLPDGGLRWDWNKLVPKKVNMLAWRALNSKLPTLENLKKIGVDVPVNCKVCNLAPENENHVFALCTLAKQVWNELRRWWYCLGPDPGTCKDIIKARREFIGPAWLEDANEAICLVYIWVMWTFRNNGVFRKAIRTEIELAADVKVLTHLWINARRQSGRKLDWEGWSKDPVLEFRRSLSISD